jgi:gas vesicle protein
MNSQMARGLAIGFLIGTAIGVAAGMLYAPHSGRITRQMISEKASQARYETGRMIDEAQYRGRRLVKSARSRFGK